jgi:hypothetical protein
MITFAPCFTARAARAVFAGSVFQCWTIVGPSSFARPTSSQAIIRFPCPSTIRCTLWTKRS